MAYGNYYYPTYQPIVYPAPQTQQQNVPYIPQNNQKLPAISSVSWIDGGVAAVKAQNLQYGTSSLFLDTKDPYFYIKTVGYDGIPQPLFIAKYKQIQEEELSAPKAAAPENPGYITEEDLDKKLSSFGKFITEEELEDRVLRVIQEKMAPPKTKKVKEEAP